MSKSFRSILVLLLSLTLIALPLCGLNASAEGETEVTVIAEGNCGPKDGEGAFSDSVIYTITSDGVLTFSGAGPTGELDSVAIAFGGQPWKAYADQFSAVVVERGVTSVGKAFFKDLVNIRTVTLADSVTDIGESAFEGCSGLSGISLPDGLRSIGGSAFRECAALRGVVIPAGVTSFGENVFRDCEDLRSAVLSESFWLIPYRTFYNCGNLRTVTIPGSVTRVDEGAFFKCDELEDVCYLDSLSRWNSISIDSTKIRVGLTMVNGNKALSVARIHSHYPDGGTSYYQSQGTATQPTCEEPGGYYRTERCNYCGAEIETKWIQTASPLGHLYGEGVVTEPATATTPGVMTYTCQRDPSHFYTEVIPPSGGSADPVATAIADPVSDIVGFQSDPSGRCDYVLYLPAEAFVDNYEAARHAENSSEGCADTYYSLNNAVFDQNGDLMAAARTEARDIGYPGLLRVQVTQDGKMYVRFAYPNNANSCDICLDIVQTYGSLTQTTSVRIEQTRNRNSAEFEFRDDAGRLFLKYRYGEPYIEQDPKVLKAQAYASCWLDLVSPWFTHTVSPNGYDIYTVNQDGILPVYPPKA
ncbi:MAG: leucine-rich repeat domain-containing protein, partial [Clostridiales bacterium]|nr:leucine-rich repeat domain-containing protein [Clostridiales bacterium]